MASSQSQTSTWIGSPLLKRVGLVVGLVLFACSGLPGQDRVLEMADTISFRVTEAKASKVLRLKLSGLSGHSALAVSKIDAVRNGASVQAFPGLREIGRPALAIVCVGDAADRQAPGVQRRPLHRRPPLALDDEPAS
jgi:hypothetical protein